jgi:hypothetical protein
MCVMGSLQVISVYYLSQKYDGVGLLDPMSHMPQCHKYKYPLHMYINLHSYFKLSNIKFDGGRGRYEEHKHIHVMS